MVLPVRALMCPWNKIVIVTRAQCSWSGKSTCNARCVHELLTQHLTVFEPETQQLAKQKMQGSLHHELLLGLSGYPGNVFRVSKETMKMEVAMVGSVVVAILTWTLSQIDPGLPFIHPGEVSLLNRICQLGTHHSRIKKFICGQNAVIFSLPPLLPPPIDAPRRHMQPSGHILHVH